MEAQTRPTGDKLEMPSSGCLDRSARETPAVLLQEMDSLPHAFVPDSLVVVDGLVVNRSHVSACSIHIRESDIRHRID